MMKVYFFKLNGCHHCDLMKLVLNSLIKSTPTISIQDIEHNDKDTLSAELKQTLDTSNINAYPELKMINKTNHASTYSGPRTVGSILEWIQANSRNISPRPQLTRKSNTSSSRRHLKTKTHSRPKHKLRHRHNRRR